MKLSIIVNKKSLTVGDNVPRSNSQRQLDYPLGWYTISVWSWLNPVRKILVWSSFCWHQQYLNVQGFGQQHWLKDRCKLLNKLHFSSRYEICSKMIFKANPNFSKHLFLIFLGHFSNSFKHSILFLLCTFTWWENHAG